LVLCFSLKSCYDPFPSLTLSVLFVRSSLPKIFGFFHNLPGNGDITMLQELEFQVLEVYRVLDTAVAGFAARTGLCCPEGCGHCCSSEKVEATVLECIPLAFELFRTLQAELILKRIEKDRDEKRCVLYRSDYTEAGLWGCTQYQYRAVVCRLFGFAGNLDRDGRPRLAMCRVMKERVTGGSAAVAIDDAKSPMPLFVDAGLRITALHPALGTVRLPINMALREALLKVGILLALTTQRIPCLPGDHEDPPNKPMFPRPTIGRRAA
jgi:Fe-S-cluster containining protein